MHKPRSAGVKLLGVLVLALGGFALATVITGVGFATPSSSSSSSSTDTTTTIPPTTSTIPPTTSTIPPTTTAPPPPAGDCHETVNPAGNPAVGDNGHPDDPFGGDAVHGGTGTSHGTECDGRHNADCTYL